MDQTERLEYLQNIKRELEDHARHGGHKQVVDFLRNQLMLRRKESFESPVSSLDDAFKAARMQGEVAGLTLAMNANSFLLDATQEELETLLRLEEEEKEYGRTGTTRNSP